MNETRPGIEIFADNFKIGRITETFSGGKHGFFLIPMDQNHRFAPYASH